MARPRVQLAFSQPFQHFQKHEDTDMFKEEQTGFADLKPKLESKIEKHEKTESDDDEYLDWKNFKCLLCRRAFTNQSQLAKHVEKSKLHRENLDKAKHPPPGSDEEPEEESDAYRLTLLLLESNRKTQI